MRVLIAEDDAVSRRLLATTLKAAGHDVVIAHDGEQALAHLISPDGPYLAILDWEMPGLTGVDVCRQIRARHQDRYRYLMLLTSKTNATHAVEAIDAGADDFIRKPVGADELDARIRAGERILALETELVAAREEMRREATYDKLTGILNRSAAVSALEREVARARRAGTTLSTVLLDIDFFKRVNDGHGHDAGDLVLRETAARLKSAVRGYDFVGRYGGEEFLMVFPGCSLDAATSTATRMRALIADKPMTFEGIDLSITASFGVAEFGPDHTSGSLITAADKALYRAKLSGRNRVERRPPSVSTLAAVRDPEPTDAPTSVAAPASDRQARGDEVGRLSSVGQR